MKAVIQRVRRAEVRVEGKPVGTIGMGIVLLLGIKAGDTEAEVEYLAEKTPALRIFNDSDGKMNLSLQDVRGEMLVISQFTLYGDCRKGRRPSYTDAAGPEVAETLYDKFIEILRFRGMKVQTGIFGASMDVELTNWGPVTLILDTSGVKGLN